MRLELVVEEIKALISNVNLEELIKGNTKGLVIGIVVATSIFIIKDNKKIKSIFSAYKNKDENDELMKDLKATMKDKNVSFEDAKTHLINETLIEKLRLSKKSWFLNDKVIVVQGERVSFVDKEIGLVQGDFLGIIHSELMGYDDLYVLRITKDGSLRQAPISYVEEDSFHVYR